MDNRLRFLYCSAAELWGHRKKAGAGNGKTGASVVPGRQEKPPPGTGRREADRRLSREARGLAVKKSRYCLHCTRTVNRHRWMRRGS